MYELNVAATVAKLNDVIEFLDEIMEKHDVPMKARIQINVAVEEIFVNIAHYAFPHGTGTARIEADLPDDRHGITLRFIDQGQPYDPLQKEDPDITLSSDERPVGGLGIFMVKKSMDDVSYEYKDNSNILTIRKYF
ncbi:MAG: ATP-binding protein [Oscillospiraceae bacterium]|nr:ATP-binding protein [Oscillospiraceae bacterium]